MTGMPSDSGTSSAAPTLIIVRGNSGSGKSAIARRLQHGYGRGCALIEQDYLRRKILRELDQPGGIAPDFIEHTARFALEHGYHVIVEGILHSSRYRSMLNQLRAGHQGPTHVFYLDVSFEETLRRHTTRPQAADFTPEQMKDWYVHRDLLHCADEHIVSEASSEQQTLEFIARTAGMPLPKRP